MSTSEGHSCVGGKVREARLRLRTERPKRKFTDVAKGEGERKGVGGVGGSGKEERMNGPVSVRVDSSGQIS